MRLRLRLHLRLRLRAPWFYANDRIKRATMLSFLYAPHFGSFLRLRNGGSIASSSLADVCGGQYGDENETV